MSDKLTLTNSVIKDIDNLSKFNNLWILDLSNNMIECVNGLSCFVAIGYLNLSNNRLCWNSLESIKALFIVHLELHGNLKLDNDNYYRQQIVDIFPRLFCLDCEFISAIEREETRKFFEKSKLDKFPIRRQIKHNSFRPSTVRNLRFNGKFGPSAFDFLSTFPNNIPLNEEWDKKKIYYMSEFLENNLFSNMEGKKWVLNWVTQLLSHLDNIQNISDLYVILVLYCVNIEFGLEEELFQKALDSNHMGICKNFGLNEFFKLDLNLKLAVICVLLSVLSIANSKIKIQNECVIELFPAMLKILWFQIRLKADTNVDELLIKYKRKDIIINYWLSKSLIAAETFMILSKVQSFFEDKTNKVLNDIIDYSTGQENFIKKKFLILNDENADSTILVNIVLTEIQNTVQLIFSSKYIMQFENSRIYKNHNPNSSVSAFKIINNSESLCGGFTTFKEEMDSFKEAGKVMEIGDIVLLGSQTLSIVLAVPEKNSALVQIQRFQSFGLNKPKHNISNQNIAKINPNIYQWNCEMGYWMPLNSFGDRVFLSKVSTERERDLPRSLSCNKKTTIDLSKISLCEDYLDKNLDCDYGDKELSYRNSWEKTPVEQVENPKANRHRAKTASPRRVLKSPNFAKLDFNEINNCIKTGSKHAKDNFRIQSTFSYPSPSSSLCSSRPFPTNDSRLWLGKGDNLYRNNKWNSRNPANVQKRIYTPGWIKSYEYINKQNN